MPALIERPKMTRAMYQALKKHIMAERDRKKRAEQEADAELERQREEEEIKRKKEEEHSLTLEQTKEQLAELNTKLESLKTKKHDLFSELKKVLHQDEESRKRKEQQNEMIIRHQFAQTSGLTTASGHPAMYYQGNQNLSGRPAMFKPAQPVHSTILPGMKRPRSPSPPPASIYQQYGGGDAKYTYTSAKPQHGPYHSAPKAGNYGQSASSHSSYSNPANYPAVSGQSGGKYTPASQSAFTSYPSHYAHQQKQIPEPQHQFHNQPGYQIPRQGGYPPIQGQSAQHDSTSKSTGNFTDDKLKTNRNLPQKPLLPGQIAAMPSTPSKGSIVTGYPIRSQAPHQSPHQSPQSQNVYATQSSTPRHRYQSGFY